MSMSDNVIKQNTCNRILLPEAYSLTFSKVATDDLAHVIYTNLNIQSNHDYINFIQHVSICTFAKIISFSF